MRDFLILLQCFFSISNLTIIELAFPGINLGGFVAVIVFLPEFLGAGESGIRRLSSLNRRIAYISLFILESQLLILFLISYYLFLNIFKTKNYIISLLVPMILSHIFFLSLSLQIFSIFSCFFIFETDVLF